MKKLAVLLSAMGLIGAFVAAPGTASASCGDGSSQAINPDTGQPSGSDTIATLPDGGVVYGEFNNADPAQADGGYIGVIGSHGYIELSGSVGTHAQVDGDSTDGPVSGTATVPTDGSAPTVSLEGVNCDG